jgi:hypothetical protein
MPRDPIVAAVQLLKKQITPQKSQTQFSVDYTRLLNRHSTEGSRVVQLICSEPELHHATNDSRYHLLHGDAKLRASYNILHKHDIGWPELDVALGHSDWTRPSFLMNIRRLIVNGASFKWVVQLATTAREEQRAAAFEPRDAAHAHQRYTHRAH